MYPWFTNQDGFEGLCLEGVSSHIKKNYLLYGLTYIEGKHKLLSLLVLRLCCVLQVVALGNTDATC